MAATGQLPREPIVALDELESTEAQLHPLELATDTIAETFAEDPTTRFLAREGHERQYMRALVALYRHLYRYEVHEAHEFRCVALVKEVPAPAAAATGEGQDGEEGGLAGGSGRGAHAAVDPSRAEASANVEGGAVGGGDDAGPPSDKQAAAHWDGSTLEPGQLRQEMEKGSLEALLALGVPRLEAAVLVHVRPERADAYQQLDVELTARQSRYMQAHGPLLHLHFLATRREEQRSGLARSMLQHLERQADTEGKHLYLEASSEESRRLYHRHGFQEVDQHMMGGVRFYIMARPLGAKSAPTSEADLQAAAGEAGRKQAAGVAPAAAEHSEQ